MPYHKTATGNTASAPSTARNATGGPPSAARTQTTNPEYAMSTADATIPRCSTVNFFSGFSSLADHSLSHGPERVGASAPLLSASRKSTLMTRKVIEAAPRRTTGWLSLTSIEMIEPAISAVMITEATIKCGPRNGASGLALAEAAVNVLQMWRLTNSAKATRARSTISPGNRFNQIQSAACSPVASLTVGRNRKNDAYEEVGHVED